MNLIPFNPWPGAPYECSSNNRIHRFAEIVNDGGLSAPVRTPRGRDISAACGQLKSASLRQRGVKVALWLLREGGDLRQEGVLARHRPQAGGAKPFVEAAARILRA